MADPAIEYTLLTDGARLDEICALEARCFSDPWPREAFEGSMDGGHAFMLVAHENERLIGYALLQCIEEEAELLNLAVMPEKRGRGIGRTLLETCFRYAELRGCEILFLEVRRSNTPARNLYEKEGFTELGVRRGYYANPREDAVVMSRPLKGTHTASSDI